MPGPPPDPLHISQHVQSSSFCFPLSPPVFFIVVRSCPNVNIFLKNPPVFKPYDFISHIVKKKEKIPCLIILTRSLTGADAAALPVPPAAVAAIGEMTGVTTGEMTAGMTAETIEGMTAETAIKQRYDKGAAPAAPHRISYLLCFCPDAGKDYRFFFTGCRITVLHFSGAIRLASDK